jgi:lycopene cyclase domain-containing protein
MLTYSTFLLFFIGFPLLIQILFYIRWYRIAGEWQKKETKKIMIGITILILIALTYTTPWDNYLVQHEIWYYQSTKVLGIVIGYVPIEEYSFFVLQTIFSGLFLGWFLIKKREIQSEINNDLSSNTNLRIISTGILLIIWIASFITFIGEIKSFTYLNLILLWAIPPISLQLLYGADLLWQYRRDLFLVIVLSTVYLSAADAIAIFNGVWTISLNTSTGILLGGVLPIEELLFFLVTNILIAFGLTLITDFTSKKRFKTLISRLKDIIIRS